MEVSDFQDRLQKLCEFAEEHGNQLTTAQVKEYFEASLLEREQLIRILQYLKARGIEIETMKDSEEPEIVEESIDIIPGNRRELSVEEQEYLREYCASLSEGLTGEAEEKLFERMAIGDAAAREQLVLHYLPAAAEIAAEYNSEEILLADLIQEANMILLKILNPQERVLRDDVWVREQLRQGIREVLAAESDQKARDQALVSRVEKLEAAVRELMDEEDGDLKFSVDELAVILDMKADEIRDILRLTGDDK